MTSSLSKVLLPFVLLAPVAHAAGLTATPLACPNAALSCSGSSSNTCCFNTPGGQLVQTQFWDSNPSTGPEDSWTIHGLWPDHCDGTYDSNCDSSRQYSSITNILKNAGQTSLLSYMNTYWVSDSESNELFWEHEWNKHGTCISTLDPSCYSSYTTGAEVVDFFNVAVDLFKTLPTYDWLANAGIVPSTTKTYTSAQIQAAISDAFGYTAIIGCKSSTLYQIWYSFEVQGSVATGNFIPITPRGQTSSCPKTGIKYLPK
ncbi:hypothetical protein DSL72_006932 [Monilinia vaccinii-corymbosi]|uniref:ribonuclease T2 n=1 Tax=Monilinia vaccinii-corymbosi TaxID=61207 RepID=A0A8A3PL22_9HELO|nr:hypothetical protein DSL72_006932 [Monilinia vaccinii-corymbosi]